MSLMDYNWDSGAVDVIKPITQNIKILGRNKKNGKEQKCVRILVWKHILKIQIKETIFIVGARTLRGRKKKD